MNRTIQTTIVTVLMITAVSGLSFEIIPNAEAKKGSSYGSDVCGLVMCLEYPGGKDAYAKNWHVKYLGGETVVDDNYKHRQTITTTSETVDKEFAAALDEHIHKFELDKISVAEALSGIKSVYDDFENHGIMTEIILGVDAKLDLHESGVLSDKDAIEAIHLTAEPQNVNPEYQGALDEVIHKFELDKISADDAIKGIKEVHNDFTRLYITSDLIEAVSEKIKLIDSGKLSGADAVEAVHLSAEPQNVNPEFAGALDEYLHKFELDKLPAQETITGIIDVHDGLTSLYITSDLINGVGIQIDRYNSNNDSIEQVLHKIHDLVEEFEMAQKESVDSQMPAKELPPNTVDMPVGAGIAGCEENNMCYTPTHLTVSQGTTVTWINSDGAIPHTVTAGWPGSDQVGIDYPGGNGFDSDFMSGGATFEHTFNVLGEYDYYCLLHTWMVGSITVE